jgi:hypothetical protein
METELVMRLEKYLRSSCSRAELCEAYTATTMLLRKIVFPLRLESQHEGSCYWSKRCPSCKLEPLVFQYQTGIEDKSTRHSPRRIFEGFNKWEARMIFARRRKRQADCQMFPGCEILR